MTQQSVVRLKELLFDQEKSDIAALHSRIEAIAERAADDVRLRAAVARVLHLSVKDAEAERHRDLSDALAPMVRRTFRAELRNETVQTELASALYPKMGDMIRRYVASQMRDMMEKLNKRIDRVLPRQNRFMLRLRSLITGRSRAELALADSASFTVEELYLVRRDSGELVHHWARGVDGGLVQGDRNNRDTLISGFLSAITSFSEEAFAGESSSLRALDFDNHRIYIRPSPTYLLAATTTGVAAPAIEDLLDRSLLDVLARHQEVEARHPPDGGEASRSAARREHEQILLGASEAIEENVTEVAAKSRAASQFRRLKVAAALIAAAVIGTLGMQAYQSWRTAQLQARIEAAIGSIPEIKGYPIAVTVQPGATAVQLTGLTPTIATRNRLVEVVTSAALDAPVDAKVGVLPKADVASAVDAELARRLAERGSRRLASIDVELAAVAAAMGPGEDYDAIDAARREVAAIAIALTRLDAASGGDPERAATLLGEGRDRLHAALDKLAARLPRDVIAPERLATPPPGKSAPEVLDSLMLLAERTTTLANLLANQRALAGSEARIAAPLAAKAQAMAQEIAALTARIEALKRVATPRETLGQFVRENAIFFSNATDFRDPSSAARILDELTALLAAAGDVTLRVVGYTDEAGTPAANMALSQSRAERIEQELAQRGVARARLIAVGRGTILELQPRSGTSNASRRVEFEIGFKDERSVSP